MNRYSVRLVFLIFLLFMHISGCQAKPEEKPLFIEKDAQNGLTASERRVMSGRISNIAESVDGVQRAVVVIPGIDQNKKNTILVGLSIDPELRSDEEKIAYLKESVKNLILKKESEITEVLVSIDPTTVGKISDIAVGIVEGKPIEKDKKAIEQLMKHLGKTDHQIIL